MRTIRPDTLGALLFFGPRGRVVGRRLVVLLAHMPLADVSGVVTGRLQHARETLQRGGILGEVVGELRKQTNDHFYDQLRSVIDNVPGLAIHLQCDSNIRIRDDVVADNLLCCIQEGITNILKHSRASSAWINIFYDDDQLKVTIRDNGTAESSVTAGNGLNGIVKHVFHTILIF